MPTRTTRTRSYSYRLFGVRHTTRYTTTSGGRRSGVSTQVHLTGRDLMEMERMRRADVTELQLEAAQAHESAMRNLSPLAVRLHTAPVALATFILLAIVSLVVIGTSSGSNTASSGGGSAANAVGSIFLFMAYGISIALFAIDWHNTTTLHGTINWPLLRYNRGNGPYWLAVCCYGLFCFIPLCVYLIQCMRLSPAVREQQRAKLQADIARLEAELAAAQAPEQESN